jgi:hypothetical protein
MSTIDIFKSANIIIIFVNIVVFMIMQILFFRYIASNQFTSVLRDKANIFEAYLKYDPETAKKYKLLKSSNKVKNIEKIAESQEMERDESNNLSMFIWTGTPIILIFLIIVVFIILLFFRKEKWDDVDTILLLSVVFVYSTEILSYYIIINKYQFYGDQAICRDIYSTLKNNVDTKPITTKGKIYYELLNGMANDININININKNKQIYSSESSLSSDIDIVRNYFIKNQLKINKMMPEVSEEFFVVYIEEKLNKISNFIDPNVLVD